ncbi:MAG: PKD-like family lipoprotein [Dysgonomonas sp.]|nr:PKD-like family lipoprotein [Dysgonomonas sp.]
MYKYIFRKYIVVIILSISCLYSCYEDKGNYDYTSINEIAIGNIQKEYSLKVGEEITIKPTLHSSMSNNNYTYEWVLTKYTIGNEVKYNHVWSTLKEWDNFSLGLPNGTHSLYYRVKDTSTGVSWTSDVFSIKIFNDISAGFFILSEVNNVGRLDFINYYKDSLDLRLDILNQIGTNLPSLNDPIGVACYSDGNSPFWGATATNGGQYATCIITKSGTYKLNPLDFSYEELYNIKNSIFGALPSDFYVKKIVYDLPGSVNPSNVLLVDNQNRIYSYNKSYRIYWTPDIYTNSLSDGTYVNVSSEVASISNAGAVFYDVDKKSFLRQAIRTTYSSYYSSDREQEFDGLTFKYNDTGQDLVYIHGRPYEGNATNMIYVVLKDIATSEFFFGRFSIDGEQKSYNKINAQEFDKAKELVMTNNATKKEIGNEFVYYRTDDNIYVYNIADNTNQVVYTAPSGHKISKMKFITFGKWLDHLMIFTYDQSKPAESCGKLQVMEVKPVYGTLTLAEHNEEKLEWDGFGKIVDADWKSK